MEQKIDSLKDKIIYLYTEKLFKINEISNILDLDEKELKNYITNNLKIEIRTQKDNFIKFKKNDIKTMLENGYSINKISKMLSLDRQRLSFYINIWNFKDLNVFYLTPSIKKIYHQHKNTIQKMLDEQRTIDEISKDLNINITVLKRIIKYDDNLRDDFENQKEFNLSKKEYIEEKRKLYYFDDLKNEEWKEFKTNYFVSNYGRIKKFYKSLNCFKLIKSYQNKNGYLQISHLGYIHRLVAKYFCDGYSETKNQVNHIDRNVFNNHYKNLEWTSASENLKHSYKFLKKQKNISKTKYGKYKKIILNNKYEFSTITSLTKFLNVGITTVYRYIDKELQNDYQFTFIY